MIITNKDLSLPAPAQSVTLMRFVRTTSLLTLLIPRFFTLKAAIFILTIKTKFKNQFRSLNTMSHFGPMCPLPGPCLPPFPCSSGSTSLITLIPVFQAKSLDTITIFPFGLHSSLITTHLWIIYLDLLDFAVCLPYWNCAHVKRSVCWFPASVRALTLTLITVPVYIWLVSLCLVFITWFVTD